MTTSTKVQALWKKFPLVVLAGGVSVILLVVLVLRFTTLESKIGEAEELKREIDLMERNIRNATSLEEESARMSEMIGEIPRRTILRQDRAGNSAYFYRLADGLSASIVRVNQRDDLPGRYTGRQPNRWQLNQFEEVSFEIAAVGRLNELLELIHYLRSSEKLIRIGDFSLNVDQAVNPAVLRIVLDVRALARKP
jgi:hypothetical protein